MDTFTNKGLVPLPWRSLKIGELCILGRGRVISQIELQRHPGDYPVYSSQSKDDGVFGYIDSFDFDGEYVTWTTDGAYAGTVFYRNGRFNCTNVCGTLQSRSDQLDMRYLAAVLSTKTQSHVSYVGNPKLMNNIMAEVVVSIPPLSEQRAIAAVLDTVDDAIQRADQLIAKLKLIKAGLLHDLLTRGIDAEGNLRDPAAHPEQFKESV